MSKLRNITQTTQGCRMAQGRMPIIMIVVLAAAVLFSLHGTASAANGIVIIGVGTNSCTVEGFQALKNGVESDETIILEAKCIDDVTSITKYNKYKKHLDGPNYCVALYSKFRNNGNKITNQNGQRCTVAGTPSSLAEVMQKNPK